jgi:thymidylate kinase
MSETINSAEYRPQHELLERLLAPSPTIIGIEGGPCSGKTTLINNLATEAEKYDRRVVLLPEAASQHILKLQEAGIDFADLITNDREGFLAVEKDILRTIHDSITNAREEYAGTDAIIVADRCDIGAYLTSYEYRQVLDAVGYEQPPMIELVDQLYFLPSVARESRERYEEVAGSNAARYESYKQAVSTCQANLEAISVHPELHVAWGGDFQQKIAKLTEQILQPEVEGELKLEVPNGAAQGALEAAVERGDMLNMMQIQQSYHQLDSTEFRLRAAVTEDSQEHYFFTVKQGEGAFRQEVQRRLSREEYNLMKRIPQYGNTLSKVRYAFLEPEEGGKKRLWYADKYNQPNLREWFFETDVHTESEARDVDYIWMPLRYRVTLDTKRLTQI